jgi:hypothetical protein
MSSVLININDILVDKSLFSLKSFLFESDCKEASLEDSFKHLGILHPVIVYMDTDGRLHLIDGKKRIEFARQTRTEKISAIVLPGSTPVTDIVTLILSDRRSEIGQSVINKILFICFAVTVSAPESWILSSLCIQFGFKPYIAFLKDCERINNLPEEIKLFCHEKKFSMKQILNLSHYPEDILLQLMRWRSEIQLTASTMDELASNLKDFLRAQNRTIKDLVLENEVQEVIRSTMSPRDKTERLRKLIHAKRFPVLSEINTRIEEKVSQLNLPENISVNWDRTLENKNVEITVHVQEPTKMTKSLNTLNSAEMKRAIESILDEL